EAKLITKPILEHHKLKGKIEINKKHYTYVYNLQTSKNIDLKKVSAFLLQKTCKVNGKFNTIKNEPNSNLIFMIQNIHLSSCKTNNNNFTDILNKHKALIYERMQQWKIISPEKTIAFITGDTSLMNKDELDRIKEIGIAHLLAISGTHIAIIITIICYILNRLKCPLFLIKIILIILLPIYCMYTNMSASAVRAILMSLIIIIFPKYIIKHSMNVLSFLFIYFSILFPLLFFYFYFLFSLSTIFSVTFFSFIFFPFVIVLNLIIHLSLQHMIIINIYNLLFIFHYKLVAIFHKLSFFKWYIPTLNNRQIAIITILLFLTL